MSRSLDITSYAPPAYIDSKLIAFSSAAGHSGGANVLRALTELATKMRMTPLEKQWDFILNQDSKQVF